MQKGIAVALLAGLIFASSAFAASSGMSAAAARKACGAELGVTTANPRDPARNRMVTQVDACVARKMSSRSSTESPKASSPGGSMGSGGY